jgi:AcrR family transcriptional regulator
MGRRAPAVDDAVLDAARPGRPRSARAHAAILDAAIALVREVGYDAVAMEAIAARAGVGKATVYRRWPSKELLVAEAIGGIVRAIPVPDTGDVAGDVLALMRRSTAMYRDPATAALLSGLVAAMARSAPIADAVRSGFVARWREVMGGVLRRAVARGALRADADVELALDLLSGPAFYRYLLLGRPIDDAYAGAVVAAVLRVLGPGGDDDAAPAARRTRRRARC